MSGSEFQDEDRSIKIGQDVNSSTIISGDGNVGVQGDRAIITITNYYYREDTKVVTVKSGDADDKDIPCPYRGLFHFGPDDAEFFYGREVFVEELFEATRTRNFIPVLGASGSGKSSVVLAGLVPRLQKEGLWLFTHFRPSSDPFQALAFALIPLYTTNLNATERLAQARQLAGYLRDNTVPVSDVFVQIQQNHPNYRVLLIVDQFEEIYTLCSDEKIRRSFLDILLATTQSFSENLQFSHVLVATMRTDFLGNMLSYPPFADVLRSADVKIRSMKRSELVQVIEKPAHSLEVSFQAGLVERILNDVENQPGNLPLLEFALTQLWDNQKDGELTHKAYDEIGGVKQALVKHAEQVYSRLSNSQQQQAQRVFLALVRLGEATEDTRRVATQEDVGRQNWKLVTYLAGSEARLVVTGRNDKTSEETVEVVHEALIREWKRLRDWLSNNREKLIQQRKIEADAIEWRDKGKSKDYLLGGKQLNEAKIFQREQASFFTLSGLASEFIQKSIKYRRNNRLRFIGFGLIPLVALTIVLGFFAEREITIKRLWSTVDAESGKTNSQARISALQELVKLGVALNNIQLNKADLRFADLFDANLSYANLSGANFMSANLSGADLRFANLSYANLSYANLFDANLSYANLSYANLSGAHFMSADLIGADLIGANLSGANFSGANASVSGANVSDANLSDAYLQKAHYTDNSTSQQTCKKFSKYDFCPTMFPPNFDPKKARMVLLK